jgi:hypothetical protein
MNSSSILGLLAMALLASACCGCPSLVDVGAIRGSGNVITRAWQVSDFDRVSLSGSGRVVITQGDDESLTVEADDNLMQYIKAEVQDRTLVLGLTDTPRFGTIRPSRTIRYNVNLDKVSGLTISGSGDIEAEDLSAENLGITISGSGDLEIGLLTAEALDVQLTGSGDVDLAGYVLEQDVKITGSGKYRAGDLESQRAQVRVSGSGDATVWAADTLDIRVTGSGDVEYYGTPQVAQRVTGSGRVRDLGDR